MLLPYHLRARKEIDRRIFLDVISIAAKQWTSSIHDAVYIGMGSIFFEDFVAAHGQFGFGRMVSIECDPLTYQRQKFNRPLSCIVLWHGTVDAYIGGEFTRGENQHVVWLDYDRHDKIDEQLSEFRRFLCELRAGDVAKITLRVAWDKIESEAKRPVQALEPQPPEHERKRMVRAEAVKIVKKCLGEHYPGDKSGEKLADLTADLKEVYANILRDAVFRTAAEVRLPSGLIVHPLTAILYSEEGGRGADMLTFTCILVDNKGRKRVDSEMRRFPFRYRRNDLYRIAPPMMTPAEKMAMDSVLPVQSGKVAQAHKGLFARGLRLSLKSLESRARFKRYAEVYRYYPDYRNIRP